MIDPDDPDAPRKLLIRGMDLIEFLVAKGFDPIHDPTDLMIVGLLPLAIKQAMGVDPWEDAQILDEMLRKMDLRELAQYIAERKH